ncbi:MAG TPA: response regulator [Bacteroidota bacterium]|nr:response regulator [Bacteroidota bacterium]
MPHRAMLKGKNVLIVEDDFVYRTFLVTLLRKTGAVCTISADSESAKTKLTAGHYDILILDYLLPGHNAMEIVKWLRERHSVTPILIVTAYLSDELMKRCKEEKNVAVISKSDITTENFLPTLADTVNRMIA